MRDWISGSCLRPSLFQIGDLGFAKPNARGGLDGSAILPDPSGAWVNLCIFVSSVQKNHDHN